MIIPSHTTHALALTAALLCFGCHTEQSMAQSKPTQASTTKPQTKALKTKEIETLPKEVRAETPLKVDQEKLRKRYTWLAFQDDLPELTTLDKHIPTPDGFSRVEASDKSYAAYLRGLPVRTDRQNVLLYNGDRSSMPSAGIIPLDLGKRDLHQCADSVIRLYAEYLWSTDQEDDATFHYTSGDLAKWTDWKKGRPLKIKGRKVVQSKAKPYPDTHKAYRKWLDQVFMYASTRSLHRDSKRVKQSKYLQSGDFFLQGGSPGHVIMILDIAENATGQRVALMGQGYLPAREFHIIKGAGVGVEDNVWFVLDDKQPIVTSSWAPFSIEDAWRFKQ